jgi:hypothetical protein
MIISCCNKQLPKCHLDLGKTEPPRAGRIQRVEGFPQPDQLISDLEWSISFSVQGKVENFCYGVQ